MDSRKLQINYINDIYLRHIITFAAISVETSDTKIKDICFN